MIAIHKSLNGFHPRWIKYCEENKIPYKLVNCYANDLIEQLKDCNVLMWHHGQQNSKDLIIAKQILFALEHTDFKVFPDFRTAWHFDDKLGQKYLFERLGVPFVPTYAFYSKEEALNWSNQASFPKVFKLRGGAGSSNVKLVKTKHEAEKLINQAFGKGFENYDKWASLKERWRKYCEQKVEIWDPIKGLLRLVNSPFFSKVLGKEIGYVYFQDFIPNNNFDIRIIVIDNKAFALKRYVRNNDFRASGSGNFAYKKEEFDMMCIKIAFDTCNKLKAQCAAFDFVFDSISNPILVEVSYGFVKEVYDNCPGYWDNELKWHEEKFNPQGWMVDLVLKNFQ